MHLSIGEDVHSAAQVPASRTSSIVQALPSSQTIGQAPNRPAAIFVSQVSRASTTPLPQVLRQSSSVSSQP
jgi:hypothetical protein